MKRYIYIAYALILTLAACQDDKLGDHENSGNATLTLSFNSSDNTLSRAVSSDEDEQIISNAYVFVFNQDGSKVFGQFYNNIHQSKTYTTKVENIPAGNGKTIAVIANINTTIHDLNDTKLDAVTSKADLLALTSHMQGDYIERGIQFLMSGMKEGAELIANQNNAIDIPLTRTDAKVRFNVQTKEGVTFTPREWQVVAIPQEVSVLPNTTQGQFEFENYFNSEWNNFEISTTNAITFAFYIPENKVNPKGTIPAEGEYHDQYTLREKQEKTSNADGSVTNGAYRYADQRATYVKLKGNVFYSIAGGQEISADVTYTIHLGGVNGVNDYNSLRNHFYTYTVTINSVDDIIVEVESTTGEEPSPGSEGDVVVAERIKRFDAHNEIFTTTFEQKNIDESLTWNVYTPFSNGAENENPKDYDWIYFNINTKSRNFYTETFVTYQGDYAVYTDAEFNDLNYQHPLDRYMNDINRGTQKMLNIKQLVRILKECKRRYSASQGNHLFDSGDKIIFTTYLKEYYYDVNPENPSETVENGLWKKFVNTQERVLNILSNLQYSQDQMSTKSIALYSIRQSSIQTMYNKNLTENFTAWGSEAIQDETLLLFETERTRTNRTYNDLNNGRKNSINMWIGNEIMNWDDYIDPTTWEMQDSYEAAKYKCLRLNRDMNGNGQIDKEEVQWYLASINQLSDLWIGENSFDSQSRLYKLSTWEINKQWYASSTVLEKDRQGWGTDRNPYTYRDNPEILWSSEGSTVGPLSGPGSIASTKVYYRCVRNLGLAKNASENDHPEDFVTYDAANRTITLTKLDPKSIRGFSTVDELPDHNERDVRGYNKPWNAFEINADTYGNRLTWEAVNARSQPGGTNPVCPKGWRVPNQRELALMYSRMPRNETSWPLNNHFSRSSFSFNTAGGERVGFSVENTGSVYYLINNKDNDRGGVRCVRDIN